MVNSVPLIEAVKSSLLKNIDFSIAYMAITILLAFYGFSFIKYIVKRFPGKKIHKFILFLTLVLFGVNVLLLMLTKLVLSISNIWIKWIVILILIICGFIKFDREVFKVEE